MQALQENNIALGPSLPSKTKVQLLLLFSLLLLTMGGAIGFFTALATAPKGDGSNEPEYFNKVLNNREKNGFIIGAAIGFIAPFIMAFMYTSGVYIKQKLQCSNQTELFDDIQNSCSSESDYSDDSQTTYTI